MEDACNDVSVVNGDNTIEDKSLESDSSSHVTSEHSTMTSGDSTSHSSFYNILNP